MRRLQTPPHEETSKAVYLFSTDRWAVERFFSHFPTKIPFRIKSQNKKMLPS